MPSNRLGHLDHAGDGKTFVAMLYPAMFMISPMAKQDGRRKDRARRALQPHAQRIADSCAARADERDREQDADQNPRIGLATAPAFQAVHRWPSGR